MNEVTDKNFSFLVPPEEQNRFWMLVEMTVDKVFKSNIEIINDYRDNLSSRPLGEQIIAFNNEPLQLAADLCQLKEVTNEQTEEYLHLKSEIRRPTRGDTNLIVSEPYALDSYLVAAQQHADMGEFDRSEEMLSRILAIQTEIYGRVSPQIVKTLNQLSGVFEAKVSFEDAERVNREALSTSRSIFGSVDPETARALNNLAFSLNEQGKFHPAESAYEEALSINLTILGDAHVNTALSYNNLGYCLHSQGKYEDANANFSNALVICRLSLNSDNPVADWIIRKIEAVAFAEQAYAGLQKTISRLRLRLDQ